MGSLLKNVFSPSFYSLIGEICAEIIPGFDEKGFEKKIFSPAFQDMELKERMRHTSVVLHTFLPPDYGKAINVIKKAIELIREKGNPEDGLAFMFLPDYVETFGLDDYKTSVDAIEFITQFVSCEFAVRPFLIKYGDRMLEQMLLWSKHENAKVRRLASEGSRPRLPWAMAVPVLKKQPEKVLPILENLKNDSSESVRRSVANSLNDIAKDRPELVLEIVKRWSGGSKETDAIIKHGSRTLLKQGHVEILKHYGLDGAHIELGNFKLLTPTVKIGDHLEFDFSLMNLTKESQKVRLEYAIYYRLQNGKLSKKVFKISERNYDGLIKESVQKKHRFVLITIRTFYPGQHQLSVIVNGEEKIVTDFELME